MCRHDADYAAGIRAPDGLPDITGLRHAHAVPVVAIIGTGAGIGPQRLTLRDRVIVLDRETRIPYFVAQFHVNLLRGPQLGVDQSCELCDEVVVHHHGYVDPWVSRYRVCKLNCNFVGNAEGGRPAHIRSAGPGSPRRKRAAVGLKPIHEAQRPKLCDQVQKRWAENLSGSQSACLSRLDDLDVTNVVARVVGVGTRDRDQNATAACRVCDVDDVAPGRRETCNLYRIEMIGNRALPQIHDNVLSSWINAITCGRQRGQQ